MEIQPLSDLIHSMHLKYNIYKSRGAAPGHGLHAEGPVTVLSLHESVQKHSIFKCAQLAPLL